MKCTRCGRDSKKRERLGNNICPGCHKPFALDPNAGDPLSDAAFKACIDAVSGAGALRWGVEHLYYEVNRRKRGKAASAGCWIAVAVPAVLAFFVFIGGARAFIVPAAVALLGATMLLVERVRGVPLFHKRTVNVPLHRFDSMWQKWVHTHGLPEGVIARKPKEERARARKAAPDLADYSFDRAVICDRARTVDLLLANNFHFENNCAVLSIGGYPEGPFETVRAMLRKNPRLQVFALHDATASGCLMAHRLSHDAQWFKGFAPVIDVGLRPVHAPPFRGLLIESPGPVTPGAAITPEEAEWLSKLNLELAAIRPEQVLKRLYRAINRRADVAADRERRDADAEVTTGGDGGSSGDGNGVDQDDDSFSTDAGDGEGAADGFG